MALVQVEVEAESPPGRWDELRPGLERLDSLLSRAVAAMCRSAGLGAAPDPFRGLHLGDDDVQRLLSRPPGEPSFGPAARVDCEADARNSSAMLWLEQAFGLSPFDLDVILVALGPHVDLKYERIYAYLQDAVTRRRPTVDLALNLL
jgi:hypothetical protein